MRKPNDLVSVSLAATEKNCSPAAIYLAIKEGRLKALRIGKLYVIHQGDLDRWEPVGHRPRKPR